MSITYEAKDYKTDLKPVWCPGCGDYGVLSSLQKAMAALQLKPADTVLISGIGCSSRLPGYVKTYGFNSIHGRALTIATGVKTARPELTVIVTGGDGDGLAIGGNHFLHAARRNLDVTYIMMDNSIYGLTKGQAAPTTPAGDKTKSTFYGNPEPSLDPCEFAISVGATWVGRGFTGDQKHLADLITDALSHKGFAFVDVISPCVTFRGKDQVNQIKARVRQIPEDHDPSHRTTAIQFTREKDVTTLGVLYRVNAPTLTDRLADVATQSLAGGKQPNVREILESFRPPL